MRIVMLPRAQFLHRRCDVHCPDEQSIVERWPGSARHWDLANVRAPVVSWRSSAARATQKLEILQPACGAEFILTGEPAGDRIALKSSLDNVACVDWLLNDRYAGRAAPQSPLRIKLSAGKHKIACISPTGESIISTFVVTDPDQLLTQPP